MLNAPSHPSAVPSLPCIHLSPTAMAAHSLGHADWRSRAFPSQFAGAQFCTPPGPTPASSDVPGCIVCAYAPGRRPPIICQPRQSKGPVGRLIRFGSVDGTWRLPVGGIRLSVGSVWVGWRAPAGLLRTRQLLTLPPGPMHARPHQQRAARSMGPRLKARCNFRCSSQGLPFRGLWLLYEVYWMPPPTN